VEVSLRARGTDHLSAAQRARRATALDWLREYRLANRFPHNHELNAGPVSSPAGRTPVFVDVHGTPCAVGYLLLRAGEHALVADVVRAANGAYVPELAGDPRLAGWLDAYGLTVAEAAQIQPAYDADRAGPGDGYHSWTVRLALASGGLGAYNLFSPPPVGGGDATGLLSIVAGAVHGGMAIYGTADGVGAEVWAISLNALAAGVSTLIGIRRIRQGRATSASPAEAPSTRLMPFLGVGRDGSVHAAVTLRH
jgi:hypothetical protein